MRSSSTHTHMSAFTFILKFIDTSIGARFRKTFKKGQVQSEFWPVKFMLDHSFRCVTSMKYEYRRSTRTHDHLYTWTNASLNQLTATSRNWTQKMYGLFFFPASIVVSFKSTVPRVHLCCVGFSRTLQISKAKYNEFIYMNSSIYFHSIQFDCASVDDDDDDGMPLIGEPSHIQRSWNCFFFLVHYSAQSSHCVKRKMQKLPSRKRIRRIVRNRWLSWLQGIANPFDTYPFTLYGVKRIVDFRHFSDSNIYNLSINITYKISSIQ